MIKLTWKDSGKLVYVNEDRIAYVDNTIWIDKPQTGSRVFTENKMLLVEESPDEIARMISEEKSPRLYPL